MAILQWAQKNRHRLALHRTWKPQQNGFVENSNGRLQDECLNETLFGTLGEARKTLEEWQGQEGYNWRRPHAALENPTPMEFLQRKMMDKMAA